jgi:hypothetical protein
MMGAYGPGTPALVQVLNNPEYGMKKGRPVGRPFFSLRYSLVPGNCSGSMGSSWQSGYILENGPKVMFKISRERGSVCPWYRRSHK